MKTTVTVRLAVASDEGPWHQGWAAYLRLGKIEFPNSVTDSVWRKICEPDGPMKTLIASDASGTMLGFLNFVVHPFTFSDRPACVAEDLYVWPAARRLGVGTLLLSHLVALARSEGWARVYWVALATNITVRRLFDTHFTKADGHVRYSIDLLAAEAASYDDWGGEEPVIGRRLEHDR